jgi:hypothetical protein
MSDADDVIRPIRPEQRARWWRQWPIAIVLAGVAIALVMIAADYFRRGSVVLAGSVLLAAFLRLLLPGDEAGMLVVRSKRIDVAVLGALGIGLTIFAFWVPEPS